MKCDELKSFIVRYNGKFIRAYEESEVDAAIAELKSENHRERHEYIDMVAQLKAKKAQLEDDCAYWKNMAQKNADDNSVMAKQRAEALKRERHQKYKRCLANAEMCDARHDEEDTKVNGHGASWEYKSKEMKYWERWHNRWLAIAEKFKPN